ncbi:MAG: hypothetical protein EOP56_16550 [Sphingobacteriales bacterium]|nr:MAG: hypothetical protein EOP56_16550 [Sphingobacteriales bacterium]
MRDLWWLEGSWIMQYGEAAITEVWTVAADTLMLGSSGVVNKQGDTVMTEQIRLVLENDSLWYMPTVSNQNNGQEIKFKALFVSDTMASFENPMHDYPQRIIYRRLSDTTIDARIEGIENGKTMSDVFHYKKVKL